MMTNSTYKPLTIGEHTKAEVQPEYIDRLCYLEDCIKKGTLVFLPCKMTNREWLQTLTDEEFVKVMCGSCSNCVANGNIKECESISCRDGRIKWLQEEHKEDEL